MYFCSFMFLTEGLKLKYVLAVNFISIKNHSL